MFVPPKCRVYFKVQNQQYRIFTVVPYHNCDGGNRRGSLNTVHVPCSLKNTLWCDKPHFRVCGHCRVVNPPSPSTFRGSDRDILSCTPHQPRTDPRIEPFLVRDDSRRHVLVRARNVFVTVPVKWHAKFPPMSFQTFRSRNASVF